MAVELSPYHQKYLNRTSKDIAEIITDKEFELKQIFDAIKYLPTKPQLKIAVLGCGVKYFVEAHKIIFKKLLKVDVDITTFDLTINHLIGEEGIVQHDCVLPLPDGPYDIIYSSILLKFIATEKQWDVLINSYKALNDGGIAIHLLGDENANAIDRKLGYNDVPLHKLRDKINRAHFKFKETHVLTGQKLNHKELGWILFKTTIGKKVTLSKGMKKIELRQYGTSDQDAAWDLHVDGLKQTGSFVDDRKYDQDLFTIKETYLDKGGEFFVALLNNEIIGMGGLLKVNNQTAEVKRMRVSIKYQNQSIGSLILESLIQKAKKLGYKKIVLDTTENMLAAQRLYEKFGFKEFKRGRSAHLEAIFYELTI
jgi:ribosomal protein S18 acetylase RimI-like enzyme